MMNIFKKYGIKEVADVTFYSITRIGDEEFYIPVLYFDSLKVSTLDKSVETVNANGGKGNGKVVSWNFNKDIKVKLEDALFSQMSLNTFMNGRVMAKLSDWTSAIAKLNVANKYGQKHYSPKAFPSPQLTPAEWEIVFRCAQKAGFDPREGSSEYIGRREEDYLYQNKEYDSHIPYCHDTKYLYDTKNQDDYPDAAVAENRWKLVDQYYRRTQPTPRSRDISSYIDYNDNDYESIQIVLKDLNSSLELEQAQQVAALKVGDCWGGWRDLVITYRKKEVEYGDAFELKKLRHGDSIEVEKGEPEYEVAAGFSFSIEKTVEGFKCRWAYISADNNGQEKARREGKEPDYSTVDILSKIFTGWYKTEQDGYNPTFSIGDEFFLDHVLYFIFPHYLEDAIGNLCWCDLRDKFHKAMPQKVIDYILQEIDDFKKTGRFENDLYEAEYIDRMEECVVKDVKGLKIDLVQQMINVKKLYANEKENFTVFYDAKTMLPFMSTKILDEKILSQKCVRIYKEGELNSEDILMAVRGYFKNQYVENWENEIQLADIVVNKVTNQFGHTIIGTQEGVDNKFEMYDGSVTKKFDNFYMVYFKVTKRDYINLKYGTVYYKWSRTIDDDNTPETFIGTDLSIDVDTFPGEYMIVGETYIREQQTGKDRRYQLLLSRTTISASTSLKLQAQGDPSTFSIDVNVLTPLTKKKSMIELRQYDVEEDKLEGGYRIVPQDKRHSYTPTIEVFEQPIIENNEIY